MDTLAEIEEIIKEFNSNNDENLEIDSIRIEFNKQYKLEKLQQIGSWNKINKNDKRIMNKLKRRLDADEITSAYKLEQHNIYYYNSNADKPKYRKAMMVIFGMKQYHRTPPPESIVNKIISILKDINSIDICKDFFYKPDLQNIKQRFYLKKYFDKKIKAYTDTYYINETFIPMLDKITIYNKTIKNNLDFICWRFEATISIPDIKYLALPLHDFKQVIDLVKETQND